MKGCSGKGYSKGKNKAWKGGKGRKRMSHRQMAQEREQYGLASGMMQR
jgi:hypothetical protein